MNDPLEELEKRFDAFAKLRNPLQDLEKISAGVFDYLLFIDKTSPLNSIAREVFNENPSSPIFQLYQKVRHAEQECSNPYQKIWLDFALEIESLRPFIRIFHMQMVEGAKQAGLTRKRNIVLHLKEARICLMNEKQHCYSMRLKGGTIPERFEIIAKLLRTKTGKSAGEIANLLNKDGKNKIVQDNIKKEIKHINTHFQAKLDIKKELIVHMESRGKNIYFLNREDFNFQTEK